MWRNWTWGLTLLAAFAALSCKGSQGTPSAKEEKRLPQDIIPAALKEMGADLQFDEGRPQKPITAAYFKDQGLSADTFVLLRRLPTLTTLSLKGCQLPADGIQEVASLSNLRKLFLTDCAWVTDADLKELTRLKQLRILVLTGCTRVTDGGLKNLAACPQLRSLELMDCKQVSDAGLKDLTALKQLQHLGLSGCAGVTAEGEAAVKAALPHCRISREPYDFTRVGVE